jgi:multidrug efflux pump subunit AcrB
MYKLIEWFARNSVAANLLMVAIVGSGIYSLSSKIILKEFPDYPFRTINVSLSYPGSTPTEIEQSIVVRLEEVLFDLEGLKEMQSRATSNSGSVSLDILDGYDMGEALDDVTNRVSTINTFPVEAERPQISVASFQERVITVVLAADLSERELKKLGEGLREEISNLPEVTLASLKAVRPYEISIEVAEQNLKQYELTFDDIVRAIRTHSIDLSAGSIKTDGGNVLLRTSQQAYTQKEFADITVITNSDGTRVTLGDIGIVTDGFNEIPIYPKFNGNPAVAIDIFRTGDQNILAIGGAVKSFIEDRQKQLPEGVLLTYWQDDSQRIEARLETLIDSAIMGFIFVLIVLSLFLRPSLALWVALGVPIAFAGAFFLLPLWGVSLNLITMFAFILVLGIVVDDAIVTGENVYQHMQAGENSLSAAIKGTQEVSIPVIFGVLTTIAAFYPLTVLSGFRGNFFKQVPIVVIPVLLFSLIESKLILPAHLKHCRHLGDAVNPKNWLGRFQRLFADGLERFVLKYYRPALNVCLNHRYITLSIFIGLFVVFLGAMFSGHIRWTPFPSIPRDSVSVTLQMPVGTQIEKTEEIVRRVEKEALALKAEYREKYGREVINNVFATSGGQPFGSSFRRGPSAGIAEEGEIVIEMVSEADGTLAIGTRELTTELRARVGPVPEAEQLNFSFARGSAGSLSVQLVGPRIEDLVAVSKLLQKKLMEYPGLYDIQDSFETANQELELELKPQASNLGVTAQNLASQVRQAFFGSEAQRIQRGRDDVRVMVRYPESERNSLAALKRMMIRTQTGQEVPFEEVANVVPGKALPSIRRIDRNRIVRVSAEGDPQTVDVDGIQEELTSLVVPQLLRDYPTVKFSLEGRAAESRDNSAEFKSGCIFVVIVIYVLLAIPFRSYFQPFIVMSAIPFGIVGAILGHRIMDYTYGFIGAANNPAETITMLSLLGILALSGVVVNDSLVMVDFINQKVKAGMALPEAVRLAGVKRFRPILLTSLTTFVGLLPLMFEDSAQAQFLIPMAISLGWGVLFATFITLMLIPTVTLVFDDIRKFFAWVYNKAEYSKDGAEDYAADGATAELESRPSPDSAS